MKYDNSAVVKVEDEELQEELQPSTFQSISSVSLGKRKAREEDFDEGASQASSEVWEVVDTSLVVDLTIPKGPRHFQAITSERRRITIEAIPTLVDVPDMGDIKLFTRTSLEKDLGGNRRPVISVFVMFSPNGSANNLVLQRH